MARGCNRLTLKVKQRNGQRRKKARLARQAEAAKAARKSS